MNPYKDPALRKAWSAGRRAGKAERAWLAQSYSLFCAWRKGFKSAA